MQPTATVLHRLRLPVTNSSSVWLVLRILFHPRTSCSTRSWQRRLKRLRTNWKTAMILTAQSMISSSVCLQSTAVSFSAEMVILRNGLKRQSAVDSRTWKRVSILSRQSGPRKRSSSLKNLACTPGPSWNPVPRSSMRHIPRLLTSRRRRWSTWQASRSSRRLSNIRLSLLPPWQPSGLPVRRPMSVSRKNCF